MDVMGMTRDLDQIRERDDRGETSKLVLIAVGGLAAACVLFAMGVLIGRDHDGARAARRDDPLARLDALAAQMAATTPTAASVVPSIESGSPMVTTHATEAVTPPAHEPTAVAPNANTLAALAPLRASASAATARAALAGTAAEPNTGVRESITPSAELPVAAPNRARIAIGNAGAAPNASPAAAGTEGAFTLQVSSFRTASAANTLAQQLRQRGHHAFVATAPPQGGVTWHRVRIGPFVGLHEAQRYRADFEARERLPTFVVRREEPAAHGD